MSSIDLCDAYYSVPVALSDQKYLVFCFEGQLYKYVCLPNGLSSRTKNIYQTPEACVFCAQETRASNNGIPR